MRENRKWLFILVDIAAFYIAVVATVALRYPDNFSDALNAHLISFSIILPLWLILLYLSDFYRLDVISARNLELAYRLTKIGLIGGILSIAVFYLLSPTLSFTPRRNLILFVVLYIIITTLTRSLIAAAYAKNKTTIFFLGTDSLLQELHKLLTAKYRNEFVCKTFDIDVLSNTPDQLNSLLRPFTPDDYGKNVFIYSPKQNQQLIHLLHGLFLRGASIIDACTFYENLEKKVPLEILDEEWYLKNLTLRKPFYDTGKKIIDLIIGLLGLIIASPLILICAILIKTTSKGPAIFKQERIGYNNKKFKVYKLRSMHEVDSIPTLPTDSEKRITPIGRLLRRTHLDELPQLWNILIGNLSLVGPRPEWIELSKKYETLPHYSLRHTIKPGITGWAQVNYKPSTTPEEAFEKLKYEIFYIKHRSFFLDAVILVRTIKHLLGIG